MSDVIFSPVFKGATYMYHECSECKGAIRLNSISYGVVFTAPEEIKYCPRCGKPVVRFSEKAIYKEAIDFTPLNPFNALRREFEDKCRWLYFCVLSDGERKEVDKVLPFAISDPPFPWLKDVAEYVRDHTRYKLSWHSKEKLRKQFGSGTEEEKT